MSTKKNPKFKFGLFNGYSYRLDLFRVKTRVSSYNLYTTVFNTKEHKLCVEKEGERRIKRGKNGKIFF